MSKRIKLKELGMVSGKAYYVKVLHKETVNGQWSDASDLIKFATKPAYANPARSAITAPLGGTRLTSSEAALTVSYSSVDGLLQAGTIYQVSSNTAFGNILKEGEATTNPFTVTGLPGDRLLYFRVKAKDSQGGVSQEWSPTLTLYGEEKQSRINVKTVNGYPSSQVTAIMQSQETLTLTCDPFKSTDPNAQLNRYRWTFYIRVADSSAPGGFRDRTSRLEETTEPSITFNLRELGSLVLGEVIRIRVGTSDNLGGFSWWDQPKDLLISDGSMSNPTINRKSIDSKPWVLEGSPYTYGVSPLKKSVWTIEDGSTYQTIETIEIPKSTVLELSKYISRRLRVYVKYVAEDGTESYYSDTIEFTPGYVETTARPAPTWIFPVNDTTVRESYKRFRLDAGEEGIQSVEFEFTNPDTQQTQTVVRTHRDEYTYGDESIGVAISDIETYLYPGKQNTIRARYKTNYRDVYSQWSEPVRFMLAEKLASTSDARETINVTRVIQPDLSLFTGSLKLDEYQSSALLPWKSTEIEMSYNKNFSSVFLRKVFSVENSDEFTTTPTGLDLPPGIVAEAPVYIRVRYTSQNEEKGGTGYSQWSNTRTLYLPNTKTNFIEYSAGILDEVDAYSPSYEYTSQLSFFSIPVADPSGKVIWTVNAYNESGSSIPAKSGTLQVTPDAQTKKALYTLVISEDIAYFDISYTITTQPDQIQRTTRMHLKKSSASVEGFTDHEGSRYVHRELGLSYPRKEGKIYITDPAPQITVQDPNFVDGGQRIYESGVELLASTTEDFQKTTKYETSSKTVSFPNLFYVDGVEHKEIFVKGNYVSDYSTKIPSRTMKVYNGLYYLDKPSLSTNTTTTNPSHNLGKVRFEISGTHEYIPGPVVKTFEFRGRSVKTDKPYYFDENKFEVTSANMNHQCELSFTSDDLVLVQVRVVYTDELTSPWSEPVLVEAKNSHPTYASVQAAPTIVNIENGSLTKGKTIRVQLSEPVTQPGIQAPNRSYWNVKEITHLGYSVEYRVEKTEDISTLEIKPKSTSSWVRVRGAYSVGETNMKSQYSEESEIFFTTQFVNESPEGLWESSRENYLGESKMYLTEGPSARVHAIKTYTHQGSFYLRDIGDSSSSSCLYYQVSTDPYFKVVEDEGFISNSERYRAEEHYGSGRNFYLPHRRFSKKENFYVRIKKLENSGHQYNWSLPVKFVYFNPEVLDPVLYSPEEEILVGGSGYRAESASNIVKFIPLTRYKGETTGRRIETGYHSLTNTFSSKDQTTNTLTNADEAVTMNDIHNSNEYALVYGRIVSGSSSTGYRYFPVRLKQSRVKNGHPETPAIVSPSANSEQKGAVRLVATPFLSEREGRTHKSTKWTIYEPHRQNTIVKEITSTEHLTSITLVGENALPTDQRKVYAVRVEYTDNTGVRSIQSAPLWFRYNF